MVQIWRTITGCLHCAWMRAYGVNDRYLYGVGGGDGGAGVSMQLQQLAGQHGQLVVTTTSRLHLVAVQHHRLHLVQLALQHRLTDLRTQSRLAASQEGCMDAKQRRQPNSCTDSPDCLPILLSISVFYFLVFLFSTFQFSVPCGRLSWLVPAFERTLKYHLVSHRSLRFNCWRCPLSRPICKAVSIWTCQTSVRPSVCPI